MSRKETDSGDDSKHGGIQVIARAGAIMRSLGAHPQGLSLAAIAQAVDLPRSTVQRIVCALEAEYLVESLGPGGGFRLGPALGQLIHQTQTDIISLARPHLEVLTRRVQESVCLSRPAGDKTNAIDRIVAERELRVVFPIGIHVPLHSTAAGKTLLAGLSDERVREVLPEPLPVLTRRTHDLPTLLAELATIRKTGFATDHEEYMEGICSFAVPLETYLGRFAVSVVVPSPRATRRIEVFRKALQECRENIERMIGGTERRP